MTLTVTKDNIAQMMPLLNEMIKKYGSVDIEPSQDLTDAEEEGVNTAREEYEKGEYITVPDEAMKSTENFLKFLNETNV